jgi:hypothetical protein
MLKLFVSYDIGGAEITCSYCKVNFLDEEAIYICDGPAAMYFKHQKLNTVVIEKSDCFRSNLKAFIRNNNISEAYCSTGVTTYELDAIKELKANNVKTNALIEHWTNYRERFGYPYEDWKNNLPEKIHFFDDVAIETAKALGFPEDKIIRENNPSHVLIRKEYEKLSNRRPDSHRFRILYLSDLLQDAAERRDDQNGFGFNEVTVFQDIREQVNKLRETRIDLVIRTHPIERKNKYDEFLSLNNSISDLADLVEDLAISDMVIGTCTNALVSSAILGKPSYSYVPFNSLSLLSLGMDIRHVEGILPVNSKDELAEEISKLYKLKFQNSRNEELMI